MQIRPFSESTQSGYIYLPLTIKEEGFIIDEGFGDMPVSNQKFTSLEFANKP